jgi:WD40 repeat protein
MKPCEQAIHQIHNSKSLIPQKASPMRFFNLLVVSIQLGAAMTAMGEQPATTPETSVLPKPTKSIGNDSVGAAVTCFALAPAGDIVAIGGEDGQIRLWSLVTDKVVRTIAACQEPQYVGCMAFSPDGKRLAFQADVEPLRLWDLATDKEVGRCSEKLFVVDQICFAPDGKLIGMVSDSIGYVWNVDSGKTWKADQPVRSMAFAPDGKTLAFGFNTLRLVEPESGRSLKEIGKMDGSVTSLKFHPTGVQILVVDGACSGTTVRLLDTVTGKEKLLGDKILSHLVGAAYSPDGKTIAVSDGARHAAFWDASSAINIGMLSGIQQLTDTLIFTPNGTSLLAARTNQGAEVQVWDVSGVLHPKDEIKK